MGARSGKETCCAGICGRGGGGQDASACAEEPVCVAISGAVGQIGYSLLPMIASGGMFGPGQRVSLACLDLDLPAVKEGMRGIEMELRDSCFPLLHSILFSTDDAKVFQNADFAILLGAYPRQEGKDRRESMEKNVLIFRTLGRAVQNHAKPGCKVLVVGHPANTNALICTQYAPRLPKQQFFAFSRLDQNRACGQIARRAAVNVADVRNLIIWGAGARLPDVDHCIIKGRPLREVLAKPDDQRWLKDKFPLELRERGLQIQQARKSSYAMSTARAIVDHIRNLHFGTRPGEFVSMGVWSDGNEYNIQNGIIYSMPVTCHGQGRYCVVPGLRPSASSKETMRQIEAELVADSELAAEVFSKRSSSRRA